MSFFHAIAVLCLLMIADSLYAQPDGKPVTIDGAVQFDLTSRINERSYRLFIYQAPTLDPALTYPALYMLDGNQYFAAGAALFLRVLEEEIKPFVAARYNVNPRQQALFGHSYGGLFVLHTLFTQPESFAAYISSSPSIWYNEREVLNAEASFVARARAGDVHAGLLLTSAEDEHSVASSERMLDNASELAERLATVANFRSERVVFAGEDHSTVPFAALSRALRFALPPP